MAKTETELDQTGDESKSGGFNVRLIYHAVRRHPFVFALVILLAGAAGAGVWFYLPLPKATATVEFKIPNPEGGGDFATYKQSLMATLKTSKILRATLDHPKAKDLAIVQKQPDPLQRIRWLDTSLKVDFKKAPDYMRVLIEGDQGDELQSLLEALTHAFLKGIAEDEGKTRNERMDWIQDRLASYEMELERLSQQDKFDLDLEGMNPQIYGLLCLNWQQEHQKLQAQLPKLEQDKKTAQRELDAATWTPKPNSTLAAVASGLGASMPPWAAVEQKTIDRIFRDDEDMKKWESAVTQADLKLRGVLQTYSNPESEAARAKTAPLRAILTQAQAQRDLYQMSRRPVIEREQRQKNAEQYEAKLKACREKVDDCVKALDDARVAIEDLDGKLKLNPNASERIGKNKTKKTQIEQTMARLAAEQEQLKLQANTPVRISVVEAPFVVPGLEGNRRMKFALGATIGMFLAGFAGLVFWEHRGRRVINVDDVSTEVGARLIGTIPPLVADAQGVRTSHSALIEAIDTARTMLMHGTPEGAKLRTILVTSAVPREGKTTLSGHLAISLTRAGFRTLLVDGDLHAPSVHDLFDLPATPGLSELLRGEVDMATAIRSSPVPGLSILPAGKWTLATRQMLVGDRWRQLKGELEAEFDFVVIDTAPLLLVSDTLLLAREVDGVVLSVLLGTSQIASISETVNRLRAIGANMVGVVVNNARTETYGQSYRSLSKYMMEFDPDSKVGVVAGSEKGGW